MLVNEEENVSMHDVTGNPVLLSALQGCRVDRSRPKSVSNGAYINETFLVNSFHLNLAVENTCAGCDPHYRVPGIRPVVSLDPSRRGATNYCRIENLGG